MLPQNPSGPALTDRPVGFILRGMVQRVEELRDAHRARATPPTERGERTRREILDVAAAAFGERGYAGTSISDVIRAAGVTKGGFYFHFASKEALALAVLRYKQEQWAGRVLAATMRHERAIDQLRAMVDSLCELHEQDPSAKSIGRLCRELAEDPNLVPQLAPQFTTWIDLTTALFARAQDEGSIRADVDAQAAGEAAVASFVGMEILSEVDGRPLRPRVEGLVGLFLTALAPCAES